MPPLESAFPRAAARTAVARAAAAGLLFASQSGWALCLTPLCQCTATTTALVFPGYNPIASSTSSIAGNVQVKCGGAAGLLIPYNIALSQGIGASFTARQMGNGGARLSYNVYTSAARTSLWGDGTGSTSLVNGSITLDLAGLSPAVDHPVYGFIPSGQFTVAPGTYSDSLTVTLTYF